MNAKKQPKFLRPGKNCWQICQVGRAALLIDGAAYFDAVRRSMQQAQRSIFIAGWDVDSRIRLGTGASSQETLPPLGEFLNQQTRRKKDLHVFILAWDFSMLYLREREWMPMYQLGWKTHRRVRFHLDDEHPFGASQHQKIVVVDDRVAFCGGFDLAGERWDTPEHRPQDPRRVKPNGEPYGAFHDVQMVIDGEAARCLGRLFRQRWQWATGRRIREYAASKNNSENDRTWPSDVSPLLGNGSVAIVRTLPAYKNRGGVKETEAFYRDAIAAVEHSIYIENQYLTSQTVVAALAQRLREENGPEVLLVIPRASGGWLEQSTMDTIRNQMLTRLHRADRHRRLKVCFPVAGDPPKPVYVHAKVMVIDDRLAFVGSANLSNRSMGLDSECGLAIWTEGDSEPKGVIASVRNQLLAEHLGTTPEHIADHLKETSSIIQTAEDLGNATRCLKALDLDRLVQNNKPDILSDPKFLDPEKPIKFDRLMDRFAREDDGKKGGRLRWILMAALLALLLGMTAAWRWTPLSAWLTIDRLTEWAQLAEGGPILFLGVVLAYVVGGILMVPLTLLVFATAAIFSPLEAPIYALTGCTFSAAATYGIGAGLGKNTVRSLAGKRLNRLNKRLRRQGILTVMLIRNLPVAPYTIVNMMAGASRIRFKDYLIGTVVGMLPGILAITLFTDRLVTAARNPSWINLLAAAAVAITLAGIFWWVQKRLRVTSETHDPK